MHVYPCIQIPSLWGPALFSAYTRCCWQKDFRSASAPTHPPPAFGLSTGQVIWDEAENTWSKMWWVYQKTAIIRVYYLRMWIRFKALLLFTHIWQESWMIFIVIGITTGRAIFKRTSNTFQTPHWALETVSSPNKYVPHQQQLSNFILFYRSITTKDSLIVCALMYYYVLVCIEK